MDKMLESIDLKKGRYEDAMQTFASKFSTKAEYLISAPGRTEVGGNHTDHQHGVVLAAAVNLDTICIAAKNDENKVNLSSAGFPDMSVDLTNLDPTTVDNDTARLIMGIVSYFTVNGYNIGGLDIYAQSEVFVGSGLSSSAAFEVLIAQAINHAYNGDKMNAVDIAKGGQFAENKFMNKPSGLMDQMASSVGGFVSIDFKDPKTPIIVPVNFDIASAGFSLCVVDTKGSHSNLTDAYAGIPKEMKSVANYFGKEVLRDVDESEFYKRIPTLRKEIGDRPVLRAIHFFEENKRALQEAEQLRNGDFSGFLQSVKDSGNSSYKFLQNIYAYPDSQAVSVAIAVSEKVLGALGAVRVHGGGFAGTIQAFVPNALLDAYKRELDYVFGEDSCHVLNIRAVGGVAFDLPSYV